MQSGVKIVGTGRYVPDRILTNHDLENMVDTSDEWIKTRTGICQRYIASDEQATSDLAAGAALKALEAADLQPDEVDLIIVATITPDKIFPNTACFVQAKIGASNATCFSVEAACSGFTYMMEIASSMIGSGLYKNALIIGAEKLSSMVNWNDRTTCVLFGDGAGAAVLKACPLEESCFIASTLGADGRHTEILHTPAGGSRIPVTEDVLKQNLNTLHMSGQEVFKLAVTRMGAAAVDTLEKAGVTVEKVRWLIPHQANTRIINSIGKRVGIDPDQVYINVDRYGNTSAASIPIALDELVRDGKVAKGDYLLFVAFGGGLTWGANLIRWS